MKACKIINFDPQDYLVDAALSFIEQPELFFQNERRATELTLRAFPYAEDELKHAIIVLLSSAPRKQNTYHLYRIMHDRKHSDEIRHESAVQLGSIISALDNPGFMLEQLCSDAESSSPGRRAVAALALGWPGNTQAVPVLIALLYDPDRVVQKNAVTALCSLREPHLFPLLAEHLKHTDLEVKC